MKALWLVLVLTAAVVVFASSKSDTTYLNFKNGKITICHDSIIIIETWKQNPNPNGTTKTRNTSNPKILQRKRKKTTPLLPTTTTRRSKPRSPQNNLRRKHGITNHKTKQPIKEKR